MRFPFAQTRERLERRPVGPGSAWSSSGAEDPSMALYVSRLDAGGRFDAGRTTANSIFAVIEGRGSSKGGRHGHRVGPRGRVRRALRTHSEYRASERSYLLRVTDEPVIKLFNWLGQGTSLLISSKQGTSTTVKTPVLIAGEAPWASR